MIHKLKLVELEMYGSPNQIVNFINNLVLSRGRGIKCFNNIFEIADYTLGKEVQFVVQKYIENPFLINGRKFDIRIWVYIEDYSPSKIWVY